MGTRRIYPEFLDPQTSDRALAADILVRQEADEEEDEQDEEDDDNEGDGEDEDDNDAVQHATGSGHSPLSGTEHRGTTPSVRWVAVQELTVVERLRELRSEISELKAANRIYWARGSHDKGETALHERRRQRLQEIKEELAALLQHSAA